MPPLALPDVHPLPPATELAKLPAVELFRQRAQAVQPSFALTALTAATVVEICRRLDGLPLASELAATWLKLLTPGALPEQLDRRLSLLTEEALTLARRHTDAYGIAFVPSSLGDAVRAQGDRPRTRPCTRRAWACSGAWGTPGASPRRDVSEGDVARERGDNAQATALYRESPGLSGQIGDRATVAAGLEGLAQVAGAQGQPGRVARLGTAAATLREEVAAPLPPAEHASHDLLGATARAALGDDALRRRGRRAKASRWSRPSPRRWRQTHTTPLARRREGLARGRVGAPPPADWPARHSSMAWGRRRVTIHDQASANPAQSTSLAPSPDPVRRPSRRSVPPFRRRTHSRSRAS